jgi:hypothetical protein
MGQQGLGILVRVATRPAKLFRIRRPRVIELSVEIDI